MIIAKILAFYLSIEPTLPTKCRSFRNGQRDENDNNKQIESPGESYRVNHFFGGC